MDDIWMISWFNHTAFDANPIWKSPTIEHHTPSLPCGKDVVDLHGLLNPIWQRPIQVAWTCLWAL